VRRSLERGVPPKHFSLDVRARDGHEVPVNVSFIVHQDRGKPALVHLLQDVSRQEQLREALRNIRDLLRDGRMRRPWLMNAPSPPALEPVVHRDAPDISLLTRREIEILKLLSHGLDTASIASQVGVSPLTARNHIQNLIRKMGLHSRTQAVALALEQGLR
jgi:DNA-binding NarL/FixJ family response regulator